MMLIIDTRALLPTAHARPAFESRAGDAEHKRPDGST